MEEAEVGQLMVGAYTDGVLSQASMDALTAVPGVAGEIHAGLGDDVEADFLVTVMPDDSTSIGPAQEPMVRDGHNLVLQVAREEVGSTCLFHTRYLNGRVLNPYVLATAATEMRTDNYAPSGGTPLYDQTVILLGTVLAKWRATSSHRPVRTFSVLISDGADTMSRTCTSASARWIVADMLTSGEHIVAAMGIDDGQTNFHRVFGEMGIPGPWILTPDASADDVARAFRTIARSVALAAGDAAAFHQLTAGPPPS